MTNPELSRIVALLERLERKERNRELPLPVLILLLFLSVICLLASL